MEKSDNINELAAALAKAQGAMKGAKKDSNNPFFQSKYADLSSCWDAIREPFSVNGLSIIQLTEQSADMVIVETVLTHSSGQWVSSKIAMKPVKNDPQGIGSCLTYARRYGLSATTGIAPEDDDGNSASGKNPNIEPITDEQQTVINGIVEDKKVDLAKFLAHMKVESVNQIIRGDYQKAIAVLKAARGQK